MKKEVSHKSSPRSEENSPVKKKDEDERDEEGGAGGEDLVGDLLTDLREKQSSCCIVSVGKLVESIMHT